MSTGPNNGLTIGTIPSSSFYLQTSIANQVNLVNTAGLTLNFWDGDAGPKNNGVVNGGNGTWQNSAGNDNWTNATGTTNAPWANGSFAIFAGAPGTVSVDNSLGAVAASGMQFATGGYLIQGGAVTLVGPQSIIRVGDGTTVGAGYVATIAASLTGNTELVKTDLGTLVLSGTNTYTGGTAIDGGTVQIASDANLGNPAGGLSLNGGTLETTADLATGRAVTLAGAGMFLTDGGTTATLTGGISGPGALTKDGAGTLVLASGASQTGGTTIAAGTLQLGNGGTSGTLAGDVTDNATLAFDRSDTSTFGGVISGSGVVTQIGSGTTVLTGANTYRGGTRIAAGTLQLGNGGTSGGILGDVADNGTLAFDRSDTVTFAGVISGSGAVAQIGSGTTILGGANTYGGGTLLSDGTLEFADGGTLGAASGATLITGGTLVLGGTTQRQGGGVTMTGGTLLGPGTIVGSVNNQAGTVVPGGATSTLTVTGNYAQSAKGTLITQVTVPSASLLAVGRAANLNGTLNAAFATGAYVPFSRYPVVTAGGGVSGTFGQVALATPPALPVTVQYLPNQVDIVLGGFTGQTPNTQAVANVLNQAYPIVLSQVAADAANPTAPTPPTRPSRTVTADFASALKTAVFLPPVRMEPTLASLGGQIYANLAEVSLQERRLFLGAMDERLRLLTGGGSPGAAVLGSLVPGGWGSGINALQLAALGNVVSDVQMAQLEGGSAAGASKLPDKVWARGYGQFGDLADSGGALGADYSTEGGALGTELVRTPQRLFGVAVSGGRTSVSTRSLPENGTVSFVELGAYGAQALAHGFAADGALIYAHDFYDVSRGIIGLDRSASSSHGGNDVVLDLGLSRPWSYRAWQITPRVGLSYFHIGQGDFTENGATSLDLTVSPSALDALRSRFGVTVAHPVMLGEAQLWPELRAAYIHQSLDDRGAIGAVFAGSPSPTLGYTEIGAATGRNFADLGAGISTAIAQTRFHGRLSAFFEYDATISAHLTNHAFAAGLKYTW